MYYFLDTQNIFYICNIAGVEAHWGDIGAAMYPVFLEASSFCGQLGACKKVGTCEKSIDSMTILASVQGDYFSLGQKLWSLLVP